MIFTETRTSYPFPAELTDRLLCPKRIIHLRHRDIDSLFTGKSGIMLEAQQTHEDNTSFIQDCCESALLREDVVKASAVLFYIEQSEDNQILMEELVGLNDFFEKINAELRWCVSNISGAKHRVIIIAM